MPPLGTAQGVPVTLVRVDEARATPIWLDGAVATRPYVPRPSGRAAHPHADDRDAYSEAVLHEALACIRAYHAAQPDWWACQARTLCVSSERCTNELAACVEAAEREPGSTHWAHVLHTNDGESDARIVWERGAKAHTYVLPPRSAFLLTDLLPPTRRMPHGWASVRALGTSKGSHSTCARRRLARGGGPAVAESERAARAATLGAWLRHGARHIRPVASAPCA